MKLKRVLFFWAAIALLLGVKYNNLVGAFGSERAIIPKVVNLDYNYAPGTISTFMKNGQVFFDLKTLARFAGWKYKWDILNNFVLLSIGPKTARIDCTNGHIFGLGKPQKIEVYCQNGQLYASESLVYQINDVIKGYVYIGQRGVYILSHKPNIYSISSSLETGEAKLNIRFDPNVKSKTRDEDGTLIIQFTDGWISPAAYEKEFQHFKIDMSFGEGLVQLKITPLFKGKIKKVDYLPGNINVRYLYGGVARDVLKKKTYKIVIDAGHGGKDPGAIGYRGLKEKDVVLDVARRLRKLIEKQLNAEVIMTRKGDYFVSLPERAQIANTAKADLFISIHCNAAPSYKANTASGLEVYFLSPAEDAHSRAVEARENQVAYGDENYVEKKVETYLEMLKSNYAYQQHIVLSSQLALKVKEALLKENNVINRGVKNAMFYVLRGVNMPSILIELGFVTNPAEAKKLRTSAYRQSLAKGIFNGLKEYIEEMEKIGK